MPVQTPATHLQQCGKTGGWGKRTKQRPQNLLPNKAEYTPLCETNPNKIDRRNSEVDSLVVCGAGAAVVAVSVVGQGDQRAVGGARA